MFREERDVGRRPGVVTIAVSTVVAAALLAACTASQTTSTSSSTSGAPSGGIRQVGGTATWAEAPNTRPNYIFPFMNLAYFTVANIYQFQYLMYRPLYWFGDKGQPTLNPSLSLAENPVYSNHDATVSVRLKPYKWSNGETVTAPDVVFWMNMMHADKGNWAGYVPNSIPDNIKSISVDGPTQLTFALTAPVDPTWFTYNNCRRSRPSPWPGTSPAPGQVQDRAGVRRPPSEPET
jgi:peptide/nickel transport system substrate-binding protein